MQYRIRSGVAFEILDDEVVVWDARRQDLHRLNAAAALVWSHLEEWTSLRTLTVAIARCARVAEDDVIEDVERCVQTFDAAGLLDVRSSDRSVAFDV
jgi:hypothetical protein